MDQELGQSRNYKTNQGINQGVFGRADFARIAARGYVFHAADDDNNHRCDAHNDAQNINYGPDEICNATATTVAACFAYALQDLAFGVRSRAASRASRRKQGRSWCQDKCEAG
jgi:hypothetical protein